MFNKCRELVVALMALRVLRVSAVSIYLFSVLNAYDASTLLLLLVLCNENCNGRGKCMSISKLYDFYTPLAVAGSYNRWDGSQITSCVCDYGYMGSSCEMSKDYVYIFNLCCIIMFSCVRDVSERR